MADDDAPLCDEQPGGDPDQLLWAFREFPKAKWRQRQRELIAQAHHTCARCRCIDRPLAMYPVPEDRQFEVWQTPEEWLHCLCEPCAQEVRELHEAITTALYDLGVGDRLTRLCHYVQRLMEG
jgi:hypothetical protein